MARANVVIAELLPPAASSAGRARELVREALTRADALEWADAAMLAVSEVVTNALVHAGTVIHLQVKVEASCLRVEITDGSPHHPLRRDYTSMAATGRGLKMLDECVDRWGVRPHGDGKVVWFELLAAGVTGDEDSPEPAARDHTRGDGAVEVELRNVPLLMHAAWQEHASALLRELLLVQLDEVADAFERHAEASDALNVLYEQIPVPELGEDPDALMATAIEPGVSEPALRLLVPRSSVPHFETLHDLLVEATGAATDGFFLAPTTQPEIQELRVWLCHQVRDQALEGTQPEPWAARTDVWQPTAHLDHAGWDPRGVSTSQRALLATDEASVVIAVSPAALAFLGFRDESDLVGRRIITIIPRRFHQAHIAGTTLHMTNGRSPLLGIHVTVPVVRADGHEAPVELEINPHRSSAGRKVFVAEFFLEQEQADQQAG